MVGAKLLQLPLDRGDLLLELVDHADRGEHPAPPGLGEVEARQQLVPLAADEVADRVDVPEAEQLRVDAMLERAAVAHQEQPPARPLAFLALRERR